jgi:hypothetical protein
MARNEHARACKCTRPVTATGTSLSLLSPNPKLPWPPYPQQNNKLRGAPESSASMQHTHAAYLYPHRVKTLEIEKNASQTSSAQGAGAGGLTAFRETRTRLGLQPQETLVWVQSGHRRHRHPNGPACCCPRCRENRRVSQRQSTCAREAFNAQKRYCHQG